MTYTVRARRPDGGNRTCQAAPATIIVPSAWDTVIDQFNIVPYLGLAAPVLAAAGETASPYLAVTRREHSAFGDEATCDCLALFFMHIGIVQLTVDLFPALPT